MKFCSAFERAPDALLLLCSERQLMWLANRRRATSDAPSPLPSALTVTPSSASVNQLLIAHLFTLFTGACVRSPAINVLNEEPGLTGVGQGNPTCAIFSAVSLFFMPTSFILDENPRESYGFSDLERVGARDGSSTGPVPASRQQELPAAPQVLELSLALQDAASSSLSTLSTPDFCRAHGRPGVLHRRTENRYCRGEKFGAGHSAPHIPRTGCSTPVKKRPSPIRTLPNPTAAGGGILNCRCKATRSEAEPLRLTTC